MFSLYIHIPFCVQRCLYCDFHSGTDLSLQERYVSALQSEMELRHHFFPNNKLRTIYLGGGTPSLLTQSQLSALFQTISRLFDTNGLEEVTIECNPDDITSEFLQGLKQLPINRVSMGVQSFDDDLLKLMGRRHTASQAVAAVELLKEYGFANISIDLMYGLPTQSMEQWNQTLSLAFSLGVQHLSAYSLTYEEGSVLTKKLALGEVFEQTDIDYEAFFRRLLQHADAHGFLQYELSNFSLPHFESKHNSAYWQRVPYLGLGASAHSFDGKIRAYNIANTRKYCESVEAGLVPLEVEELTREEAYNDAIITALRTARGVSMDDLRSEFGTQLLDFCMREAQPMIKRGLLVLENGFLRIPRQHLFISDNIMSDLLWID